MTDTDKFIEVWQRSSSAIEVAEELGIQPASASCRASAYRSQGIDLKDMSLGKGPGIYLSKLALAKKEIERLTAEVKSAFEEGFEAGASSMGERGSGITVASAWSDRVSGRQNPDPVCDRCGEPCCGCYADEAAAADSSQESGQ